MAEFFTILLFVNIAAWVYFLIKPLSLVIQGNTFPRWKIFLGGIFSMMILLAAIGITAPPVERKPKLENKSSNALVKDKTKSENKAVEANQNIVSDEVDKNEDAKTTNSETSNYDEKVNTVNTFSLMLYSMSQDAVIETSQLGALMNKSPDDRYAIYKKASSVIKTIQYNNSKFKEHLEENHGKYINNALKLYINGNDKYITFLKKIAYMADENIGLKPSELQTAIDKLGQAKLDFARAGNEMRKHLIELGVKESDINEHGYIEK